MVKLTKMVSMVKLTKTVKIVKLVIMVKLTKTVEIDQDGEDQEPNDQPATIYLAMQGLVATLVVARHAPTFPLSKISGNKSSVLEVSGVSHLSFKVKPWEIREAVKNVLADFVR